jgi:phage terminase large subunit-like protein
LPIEGFESLPLKERIRLLLPYAQSDPEVAAELEAVNQALEANPLLGFEPHPARDGRRPQLEFIEAMTRVVAAFAANQFGKSTVLTLCSLRECLPRDVLPDLLKRTKRFDGPVSGWLLCPTEDKIFDSFQPAFEEWCPPSEFLGGSWGKAFKGDRMELRFKCGSSIHFKTYKQDPSTLGGARLHFVGYDEPPPKKHREECRMRTVRYGGYEMFAMTPLDTNTAYVRRAIWKQREHPDISVVRGSIHDNPTLDASTVQAALGDLSDIWRRAREFGEFVDVGGLIYPDFERCVVGEPWPASRVHQWDVVVGIDPGIRNAGIVFVGFDGENTAHVFDALLLQDSTPKEYAAAIRGVLSRWGIPEGRVSFVADPAARQRGQTNAETVVSALAQERVYCNPGQNDVQTGIGQLRTRMAHRRFLVSPERSPGLLGLRDEADEYAAKEPDEGKDDSHLEPVKSHDHRLDALRYACMERFWDPSVEEGAPGRNLGFFDLGHGVAAEKFGPPTHRAQQLPMGWAMM